MLKLYFETELTTLLLFILLCLIWLCKDFCLIFVKASKLYAKKQLTLWCGRKYNSVSANAEHGESDAKV